MGFVKRAVGKIQDVSETPPPEVQKAIEDADEEKRRGDPPAGHAGTDSGPRDERPGTGS